MLSKKEAIDALSQAKVSDNLAELNRKILEGLRNGQTEFIFNANKYANPYHYASKLKDTGFIDAHVYTEYGQLGHDDAIFIKVKVNLG